MDSTDTTVIDPADISVSPDENVFTGEHDATVIIPNPEPIVPPVAPYTPAPDSGPSAWVTAAVAPSSTSADPGLSVLDMGATFGISCADDVCDERDYSTARTANLASREFSLRGWQVKGDAAFCKFHGHSVTAGEIEQWLDQALDSVELSSTYGTWRVKGGTATYKFGGTLLMTVSVQLVPWDQTVDFSSSGGLIQSDVREGLIPVAHVSREGECVYTIVRSADDVADYIIGHVRSFTRE